MFRFSIVYIKWNYIKRNSAKFRPILKSRLWYISLFYFVNIIIAYESQQEYVQYAQNFCKHWNHRMIYMRKWWKPKKFVLTIFLGIFLSLPTIFSWKSHQLQRSLDKGVSGSFLVHAALCNRNCMSSTSRTKSFKKL